MVGYLLVGLILAQVVQFQSNTGYAEVVGSPAELVWFYESWRDCVAPDWRTQNRVWWDKESVRVQSDSQYGQLLYARDRRVRLALLRVIMTRGVTVRFRASLAPFGSCWLYYNSLWHAVFSAFLLLLVAWWLRRYFNRRA